MKLSKEVTQAFGQFATVFLTAITRAASAAGSPKTSGRAPSGAPRLPRGAPVDTSTLVKWLTKHGPARSEQIQAGTGLDKAESKRVLKAALAAGEIYVESGQKRATAYAAGKGKAKKTPKKPAKAKPARKSAKTKPAKAKARAAQAKPKAKAVAKKPAARKASRKPAASAAPKATNHVADPPVAAPPEASVPSGIMG